MSIVTLPYSFANGDDIDAAKIQADFNAIVTGVNNYFGNTVISSLPYSFADGGKLYSANVMANLRQIVKQVNVLSLDAPLINALPFSFTGFTIADAVQFQTDLDAVTGDINAIGYSAAAFLAVNEASATTSRSPNGAIWRQVDFPLSSASSVVWNGTIYCVIGVDSGFNSKSAISYDGVTWHVHDVPTGFWNKIVWSGTLFCALDTASNQVITSPDGIVWTAHALPAGNDGGGDIAWNGTVFCVVTPDNGGGSYCSTSPTGVTWTHRASFPADASGIVKIAWNGTTFCVICDNQNVTSPDGITWNVEAGWPTFSGYVQLVSNGSDFLALNTTHSLISADDGVTWNDYSMPSTNNWAVPTWNGYVYCTLVFDNGTPSNKGAISADGQSWTAVTLPYTSLPVGMTSAHLTFGDF